MPLLRAGRGRVVHIGSMGGRVAGPGVGPYSASKHAVTGFVHTLRRQVLQHGIRVMSVAPGYVANELWGFGDPAAITAEVEKRAALTSENVAEAVLFMLSQPPNVTIRDLVMLPQAQDL